MTAAAVVLAAGEGKRLKSGLAKVLHQAGGRALLDHVLAALEPLQVAPTVVVVGHLRHQVEEHLGGRRLKLAIQDPPRGTGDAVAQALTQLPTEGEVLVLSGDAPLITTATLQALLLARRERGAAAALLTAVLGDGASYGRVLRDSTGDVTAIVEARDATPDQRRVREVNAGTYVFDIAALRAALPQLQPNNDQGEYYLTDVIGLLVGSGMRVVPLVLADPAEMLGVNTRAEIAAVHRVLNGRTLERLMREGVTVLDPTTTWIDADCLVGRDTVIEAGVHLRAGSRIGERCRIGAHAVLENATVPDGSVVAPLSLLGKA